VTGASGRPHPGSFRDPSGFLFERDGILLRQINRTYREPYEQLMTSGLYDALVQADLLIPHREVPAEPHDPERAYKVLQPDRVPFVSFPHEWCFSQLRDAAVASLRIQQVALTFGMALKDCPATNIQFVDGVPRLVDTLSFEPYAEGRPWTAYRQACQHFLAPLALMSYRDARLGQLLRTYLDGLPLDLASRLLPRRTWLRFSLFAHLHLHARAQTRWARSARPPSAGRVSRRGYEALVASLLAAIGNLSSPRPCGAWLTYRAEDSYTGEALVQKRRLVAECLDAVRPRLVWDLGANTGTFAQLATERGSLVVAADGDHDVVERNYRDAVERRDRRMLPLWLDITNPSPALGWANTERPSWAARGPADCLLALALLHHIAIGHNVPLGRFVDMLGALGRWAVVEFVPKDDPQVRAMLAHREDVFADYTMERFEREARRIFTVERVLPIPESPRTLFLLRSQRA
jgi:hypothetical protein